MEVKVTRVVLCCRGADRVLAVRACAADGHDAAARAARRSVG